MSVRVWESVPSRQAGDDARRSCVTHLAPEGDTAAMCVVREEQPCIVKPGRTVVKRSRAGRGQAMQGRIFVLRTW